MAPRNAPATCETTYGASFANFPDSTAKPKVTAGLMCASGLPHAIATNTPAITANDHPTGAFSFGALEQNVRDHSVAQQYQYKRSHELAKTLCQHVNTSSPDSDSPISRPNRTSGSRPAAKGGRAHRAFRSSGWVSRCGRPPSSHADLLDL